MKSVGDRFALVEAKDDRPEVKPISARVESETSEGRATLALIVRPVLESDATLFYRAGQHSPIKYYNSSQIDNCNDAFNGT